MIGQRLSHYHILEQIGAGGMGVVYRAHDEQLDRDVAIKVLPPGSLTDEAAHKRFRKEALSLARLNHPNIATVHEFSSQDGVDFLVTEFIAGTTLDTKLARGALPPAEVVRLGLQLGAGLAAAHKEGIVHRDLKPGNLRLTTDGRLKILDFGLAQLMPHPSEHGATVTATRSQDTSGTLPYMSPEQLSGEVADARSDIWAAGAVLYEMSTGKRPFLQSVPALLINAILNQQPEPPRKLNAAMPALLDAAILRALARDPERRQQSAGELAADLSRVSALEAVKPNRSLLIFSAVAIVLLLAIGGYVSLHRQPLAARSAVNNRRRSVAVLGFKNLSANPEKSWLSTALSEMLTTELGQGDQLRTIAGETVAQMKASLALPDANSFSQQTLSRIRQNIGSDEVVVGSYVTLGDGVLRLDVRLQDAVAGETLASVSEKGNESEIDTLVSKAGAELRAKLGVGALSDAQSALVRASLPSNSEAARLYAQGLQRLRMFDSLTAQDLLTQAAALDPQYAPTHSALAEAWSLLGYDDKAKDQAKQAIALSEKSSREERLFIEGRAHELLAEHQQAVESYRALWGFFPDNVDYGLALLRAQVKAGRTVDAEATLAQLRKQPVSDADEARIDLAEVDIATITNDFKRQQALAARAAARGQAVGANLIAARALQVEGDAWEHMGDASKAVDFFAQAKKLFDAAGDRRGSARVVLNAGDVLYDQGDYQAAQKQFERALPVFQEIGARRSVRAAQERIGNVFYSEGKMQEARKYYELVLVYDRESNNPQDLAGDFGNLANALDALADLAGALKMQQDSLAKFNEIGDKRGASATMNNLGNLYVEMGDLDDAQKNYEESLGITRQISFRRGEPYPMAGLGDVLAARGQLAEARKQYENALALCEQLQDEDYAAQIRVALAAVALFEKRYSDGVSLATQAAGTYEKTNSANNAAWARSLLARNLLGEGKTSEAQVAVTKAAALASQSTLETPRYEVALAEARLKASTGKTAEARDELQRTLASARKFGYLLYELQMRLALGEIGMHSRSASASADLATLETDARARGALLVAAQAQQLRTQH